jgi:hypothetical protein
MFSFNNQSFKIAEDGTTTAEDGTTTAEDGTTTAKDGITTVEMGQLKMKTISWAIVRDNFMGVKLYQLEIKYSRTIFSASGFFQEWTSHGPRVVISYFLRLKFIIFRIWGGNQT